MKRLRTNPSGGGFSRLRSMRRLLAGAFLVGIIAATGCERGMMIVERPSDEDIKALADVMRGEVRAAQDEVFPKVVQHAQSIAELTGKTRVNGTDGLNKVAGYVGRVLRDYETAGAVRDVREFKFTVTSAVDEGGSLVIDGRAIEAYGCLPNNCITSRRQEPVTAPLVYGGTGNLEDLYGRGLAGKIVVLEMASGEAWLDCMRLGAVGTVFLGDGRCSVFQADKKFVALLPVDFPRAFIPASSAAAVRKAAQDGKQASLKIGVDLRNVDAPCWEAFIPGKSPDAEVLFLASLDSYSITPGLAPGGSEIWGPASLLGIVDYYKSRRPNLGIRIAFLSGQRPSLSGPRQYLVQKRADGATILDLIGTKVLAAFAFDLSPGTPALTMGENGSPGLVTWLYGVRDKWIEPRLFPKQGWWYDALCMAQDVTSLPLFGNALPVQYEEEGSIAPRKFETPFGFTPLIYTPEEPFFGAGGPGYKFQSVPEQRSGIFTPEDAFSYDAQKQAANLKSQLGMLCPILSRITALSPGDFTFRGLRFLPTIGEGGYVEIRGQVGVYKQEIVWYDWGPPKDANGREIGRTYVTAIPTAVPLKEPSVIPGQMTPWMQMHQDLQMFSNYYLMQADHAGNFYIPAAFISFAESRYHFLAVTVDDNNRIIYANDLGLHGGVAFPCRDRKLESWSTSIKLSLFPCGSVVLFDLFDPERYAFNRPVPHEGWQHWGWPGHLRHTFDDCEPSLVPIREVREAATQTDAEYYGFLQYGEQAVVFLKPGRPSIVLAGQASRKFLVLGDFSQEGKPRGLTVERGQTIVFHDPIRRYYEELGALDGGRIEEFGALGVRSPQAEKYHVRAKELSELAGQDNEKPAPGGLAVWAGLVRAWQEESRAYSTVLSLKFDVVKTTVFYFILLIPFAFLMERLLVPQISIGRTLIVSAVFFIVFALALWKFHPGFKLAENVFITIISFIIVLLTVPALILLLGRGTVLLRSLAGRYARAHYAREEHTGMLLAALSLTVSNMRRRRLRTGLTLGTITLLVLSLVLLTSFTAVDQVYQRPEKLAAAPPYEGIAVYNTYEHIHGLLPQVVRIIEAAYSDSATVLRREYLNYGYQDSGVVRLMLVPEHGLPANWLERVEAIRNAGSTKKIQEETLDLIYEDQGLVVPTLQLVSPEEPSVTRADKALVSGRWFNKDDVYACLLSSGMAKTIGVSVNDRVRLAGKLLTVVGIFDEKAMDEVRDINGDAFTCLLFTSQQETPEHPAHQPSLNLVFMPRAFNEVEAGLLPSAVWSMIVVPKDPAQIVKTGEELARELRNVDVYISKNDSVTVLSAHAGLSIKGGALLIGPLIVTFFLILNIMLGTVYERTREINIFSSVGLSPKHVAGMFLTESLVYAGIASVLGYFIGIVLLYFFRQWGFLPKEFAPNYLGAVVIYATGLAVAATVMSSIYPMIVAARTVNPSLERSWQVATAPVGDDWEIPFPFIATTRAEALGILEFMREFVDYNIGEPKGVFAAGQKITFVSDPSVPAYGLEFDAWLAPFERNVTEKVLFTAHRDPEGRPRWHFAFRVKKLSGPAYLWLKSNRHFVDAFRKQMLLWRAFPDDLVNEYSGKGAQRWEAANA